MLLMERLLPPPCDLVSHWKIQARKRGTSSFSSGGRFDGIWAHIETVDGTPD
jgi:hypothetical protein